MKNRNETSSRFEQMRSVKNGRKYRHCFFNYLYYRLYVTYKKHNDPPRFSACCVLDAPIRGKMQVRYKRKKL